MIYRKSTYRKPSYRKPTLPKPLVAALLLLLASRGSCFGKQCAALLFAFHHADLRAGRERQNPADRAQRSGT